MDVQYQNMYAVNQGCMPSRPISWHMATMLHDIIIFGCTCLRSMLLHVAMLIMLHLLVFCFSLCIHMIVMGLCLVALWATGAPLLNLVI